MADAADVVVIVDRPGAASYQSSAATQIAVQQPLDTVVTTHENAPVIQVQTVAPPQINITAPTQPVQVTVERPVQVSVTVYQTGPMGPAGVYWMEMVGWPCVSNIGQATIGGSQGVVNAHTKGSKTVFRFVPSAYDPTLDGFYSAYSDGVLSDLICTRG